MNTPAASVEPESGTPPITVVVHQFTSAGQIVSLSKEDLQALAIYNQDHLFLPAHAPLWENPLNDC